MRTVTALFSIALVAACGGKLAPDDSLPVGTSTSSSSSGGSSSSGSTPPSSTPPSGPIDLPRPPGYFRDGGLIAPPDPAPYAWKELAFKHDLATTDCDGTQYVRQSAQFQKWVGVQLCSPTRYKIYLAESPSGIFRQIADGAGGGEDHCELVNPTFTLAEPSSSDITSGSCASCANESVFDHPIGELVYMRSLLGQPFQLDKWPQYNLYTSTWYECGVSIP